MTETVCGKHGLFDGEWNPLSIVYRRPDLEEFCDHGLRVYARKATKTGQSQVRETCVECGHYASQQLKLSDHPQYANYPVISTNFAPLFELFSRRSALARKVNYVINDVSDSGGGEIARGTLWHRDDLRFGMQCADSWNDILDKIPHTDIPRERARALQYGLVDLWYHDKTIDFRVAVSFDPNEYGVIIASAVGRRFPVHKISISTDVDAELTRFGDGFRYSDYLSSVQWTKTRHAATWWPPNERSRFAGYPMCEMPNCSGQNRKIDCHHLTYARAGHEEPGDLIFACAECHQNLEYVKNITPIVHLVAETT